MDGFDSFRWVLLIIGIIVFYVVYLVSKASGKSKGQTDIDHDFDRLASADDMDLNYRDHKSGIGGEDGAEASGSEDSTADPESNSEKFITVYLVSETGRHFSGSDIMRAAKATDLVLGEKNIFHKNVDLDGSSVTVFSMANITEPGTFDVDEMYRFTTIGLVFFMELPCDINGLQAYEMLINTVSQFKKLLKGILTNRDKTVLTEDTIQQLREEVQASGF